MAQNPPDPQESFGATKAKAVTEEDVRVSHRLLKGGDLESLTKFESYDDEERLRKEKAELELKLMARFETVRDPLILLGSAGSLNVSTSELRVMAARTLADLFFDVQSGFNAEVDSDNKRVASEQEEAAKKFEEQKRQHEEDDSVPDPTVTPPANNQTLRTTTPEAELDYLADTLGKRELVEGRDASPKLPRQREDSAVDENRSETPARRENQVQATGANPKPDGPSEREVENRTQATQNKDNHPSQPAREQRSGREADNKK